MNYVYSVFKKSLTTKNGTNSYILLQVFTIFVLFGLGGLVNVLAYYWYSDLKNLFFGVFIAILIALGWILIPGYKYLESVKNYSEIKANLITGLILFISIVMFVLPVYFLVKIKCV
jgi:hypothetical protein